MLKTSHAFNLLDARGVVSVTERASYIARVRDLSKACAKMYIEKNNL
jgi:glycyl-tRNA synthetase alpha chain